MSKKLESELGFMYIGDSNSKERFFMPTLPSPLFSQLAHVELLTPVPAESLAFFTDVLGLELTEQAGQSAYLRGWGEDFHHSLKRTEVPPPAPAHMAWRGA